MATKTKKSRERKPVTVYFYREDSGNVRVYRGLPTRNRWGWITFGSGSLYQFCSEGLKGAGIRVPVGGIMKVEIRMTQIRKSDLKLKKLGW